MCKGCTRVSCVLLACVFTRVLASCCFCRLFDCLHVCWLPALLATAVSSLFVPRPLPPYGTIGRGKSCAPMLGLWHMLCQTSSGTGMSAVLCYGVLCYPPARKNVCAIMFEGFGLSLYCSAMSRALSRGVDLSIVGGQVRGSA